MQAKGTTRVLVLTGALTAGFYILAIRPWHLTWGSTREERRRAMLGDERVDQPWLIATRAITIDASPQDIWPWLVQMGFGRVGWYSYDWIDNQGHASANRLIREFQDVDIGTIFPTGPNGGFTLVAFEPERSMLLEIREPDAHITFSVQLSGVSPLQTRLIGRLRLRFKPGLRSGLYFLLFEPGDFVMMRKMFLGIKTRAERFHGSVS